MKQNYAAYFYLNTFIFTTLCLCPFLCSAATFTAVKTGNWSDPATWSATIGSTATPKVDDDVIIKGGFTVTVAATNLKAECSILTLEPAGTGAGEGGKIDIFGKLQVVTVEQLNSPSKEKVPRLLIATGGHLKISGAFNMQVSSSGWVYYVFEDGSTVEYNGTGTNQQVESRLYYKNLIFSGAGTKNVISALNVAENFTIDGSANFIGGAASYTHTIGGNWTNNSSSAITFTEGNSTVLLTGSLASLTQVKIGGTAETTFNNLTITLPTTPVKSALMTNNITVKNNLSLSNGKLNTGTGTLANYYLITLSSTANLITVETNNSYINGRIASTRTIPASGAQGFGGIAINISRNAVDPGSIKVERITGFTLTDGVDNSVPRYFDVQRVSAGDITGTSLTMNFTFLSMEIPPSIDDYVLVRELSPGKFTRPKFTKQSITTVQNVNSGVFSKYTLAKKIAPLPVDLVWFKAETHGSAALLTWQTAWERENAGFAVQFSEDGEEFRQVGFVQEGSATKNGAQSYSFVHEDYHKSGTRYYRLAQHDLDGTVTYSPVRVVEIRSEVQLVAYPNPFTDELTVVLPSNAPSSIIITNQVGQEVYRVLSQEALHSISLGASLQSGVYFLTVRTANETYARKLIKR